MKLPATDYDVRLTVQGDEPAFNEDGVDLTQIRRALALTPLERLVLAEQAATEIRALQRLVRVKGDRGGER